MRNFRSNSLFSIEIFEENIEIYDQGFTGRCERFSRIASGLDNEEENAFTR